MAGTPPRPSEVPFVVATDTAGIDVRRRLAYDLWVVPSEAVAPLVVLVHGPVRDGPRPREWPVYRGYGALLARAGLAAVVVDLNYTSVESLAEPTAQLDAITETARSEPDVDETRAVIWAFSGGARLVAHWIEEPPTWLRGIGLTYPVVAPVRRAQVPIVLTRVGLEQPRSQETVEQLVAVAPEIEIIDLPNGRHGFDGIDHNDESRQAVTAGIAAVTRLLS